MGAGSIESRGFLRFGERISEFSGVFLFRRSSSRSGFPIKLSIDIFSFSSSPTSSSSAFLAVSLCFFHFLRSFTSSHSSIVNFRFSSATTLSLTTHGFDNTFRLNSVVSANAAISSFVSFSTAIRLSRTCFLPRNSLTQPFAFTME